MKKLNDCLARRFYDMCEDVKNSQNSEYLNYYVGTVCGFASGLLLSHAIDFDCYIAMHEYISVVREGWHSTK